jgi:hypothetical protein
MVGWLLIPLTSGAVPLLFGSMQTPADPDAISLRALVILRM